MQIVQNEKIERMTPEFVYRGEKIKAIRGTSINYLAKDLKQAGTSGPGAPQAVLYLFKCIMVAPALTFHDASSC